MLGAIAQHYVAGGGVPTYGSVEYANASTTGALVFNKPSGTVAGSLLIATVTSSLTATWTGPGGNWIGPVAATGGGAIFYLICGGSEPATYSFDSNSDVATHRGALARFEGANQTTPVAASAGAAVGTNGSSPTVTATTANSLLYCALINTATNTTAVTQPAGMTSLFLTTATAYKAGAGLTVGAGATGAKQWTNPSSTSYATSVAINPA